MTKNKDINITPAKGISIVIRNDFQQPPQTPKKKRKFKRKPNMDLLRMPTIPSYIPAGDVSYIKPQYSTSSLNRNMIFPGVPQSLPQLPAPPPIPQIMPPPPLPQIMPSPQAPVNIIFDNMFGNMLENMMMPREYGFKNNSYAIDTLDDDIMDALPQEQQDTYIQKKLAPQVEKEMKDIEFEDDADKIRVSKAVVTMRTAKEWGTKHANRLMPLDDRYKDSEHYINNYVARLQQSVSQDSIRTRTENKVNTPEHKAKARDLLKAIGVVSEYVPPPPTIAEIPKPAKPEKPPPTPAPVVAEKPAPAPSPPTPAPGPVVAEKPKPAPPPPPPVVAGKGPPPPPPPPPKPIISADLLNELEDTKEEKEAKAKAEKLEKEGEKKGDLMDEIKAQHEKAPKQAGTKNGKSLSVWTEKYIDNLHYRKNYISELEKIVNDEKISDENKTKAKELMDTFEKELIKRAKDFFRKDTSIETLYPLRTEYKEFKKEYFEPYMKKMKEHQEETKQKLADESKKLKEYKEMDKHENRKTLTPEQKRKLNKKLEASTESVKKLSEFLDKINEFSGLK